MSLPEIKNFFQRNPINQSIVIRRNELIHNPNKTALSIIRVLESNSGNKAYKPYAQTLVLIYKQSLQLI